METTTLWQRVLEEPAFQELPFKVETNEQGQLILSPHSFRHSLFQGVLVDVLRDHISQPGRRAVEFPVQTTRGVRVPDVIWISAEVASRIPENASASPVMPELVVEVISESNTDEGLREKRNLYFQEGAQEVWFCDLEGKITWYDADGQMEKSRFAPSSPDSIK